jgi:hypothetical protein
MNVCACAGSLRGADPPPVRFVQGLLAEFTGTLFLAACMGLASAETDLYLAVGCLATALQYGCVYSSVQEWMCTAHAGTCLSGSGSRLGTLTRPINTLRWRMWWQ